jgi:hypothetical protein
LLVFSPTSNNAASPHHRKHIYPWSALVGVFTNKNYEKGNTILLLVFSPTRTMKKVIRFSCWCFHQQEL